MLVICLLILALLSALAVSQGIMVQRNLRQSVFYNVRTELREYAESGIGLAIHDLNFHVTASEGTVGTALWSSTDDVGADGIPGSADEGELDGIPTVGEPNVVPEAVGPVYLGGALITYVEDTVTAGVKRVISSAVNGESSVTVEAWVKRSVAAAPRAAPLFVMPAVSLNLSGSNYTISGFDHDLDGSAGSDPAIYGIATVEGTSSGDNAAALLAQISSSDYSQIDGGGGSPSVGEVTDVDTEALFSYFKAAQTQSVRPGTYSSNAAVDLGDASTGDYRNTYVGGDLDLSGNVGGAGVLVVEGDLSMTGQSEFNGLVIVRGNVTINGGGARVHIYGSLISLGSNVSVGGSSDIFYSEQALDGVDGLLDTLTADYALVYYRKL